MLELEFIIAIACIFGKDISGDPSSCVVWPRVQCLQILIHLELSSKGFLVVLVFSIY